MHPILFKLAGAVVVSLLVFTSPMDNSPKLNERHNIENAQIIADRTKEDVKVWLDKNGHVNIQSARYEALEPYTIYHSTWKPGK